MFGLSLGHIILFGVILLIFVGPEQLPEVARTIARVLNELKRATSDFQNQFTSHIDLKRPWENQSPVPPQPTVLESPMEAPEVGSTHGYPDAPPGEQPLPIGSHPVSEDDGEGQKS